MVSSIPPFYRKRHHSANLLFGTKFSGVTINNPDTFLGSGVWRHISGEDTLTGFSHIDLAAGPLFVQPPGGGITGHGGYGLYYINLVTSPYWPTNDLAGVEAKCPTTTGNQIIRGVSVPYMKMTWLDSGPNCLDASGGYRCQSWITFHRDLTAAAMADIPEFCIRKTITLQDHATMFDANCRYRVSLDIKTWDTISGGDNRIIFGIMRSNGGASGWHDEDGIADGKIGFYCQGDNRAGTLDFSEFFRVKNFDVDVPVNEAFEVDIYWKRTTSYFDRDSGGLLIIMRKQDNTETVLFDINKASLSDYNTRHPYASPLGYAMFPMQNIHCGVNGGVVQRIFADGIYFGGKTSQVVSNQCSSMEIFDGLP